MCADPSLWNGSACDEPVCAPGCSTAHGGCSAPSGCSCVPGWGGPRCTVQLDVLRALGEWVTARAAPLYIALTALGFFAVLGGLASSHLPEDWWLLLLPGSGGARARASSRAAAQQLFEQTERLLVLSPPSHGDAALGLSLAPLSPARVGAYGTYGLANPLQPVRSTKRVRFASVVDYSEAS